MASTTAAVRRTPSPIAPSSPAADSPIELTVFAAASLRDVATDLKAAYDTHAPGVTLVVATDSSATLRTQIEQGAPADVFLSADTANPQALVDAGLTTGPGSPFAGNVLTVIVPDANEAGIRSPSDLARPGVAIIAAGDKVPITKYASKVVTKLAALDGYPADFAAAYTANIVSREDNVKAVVAKVGLGEGDAAIVYVTDATAAESTTRVDIPEAAYVTATYAAVVIKASAHATSAQDFLDWLVGDDGQGILARHGFLPPAQ